MIFTIAYILAAVLSTVVLNPFLVVGLVIADLIALFLLVVLVAAYWQKQTMEDFSDDFFENGDQNMPWSEEDVEEFMSNFNGDDN